VVHPEPLLLVDDQQTELAELHVVAQQAMGADDHVDLARGESGDDGAGLGVGEEAAEHLHPDGEAGEPLTEGLEVLLGQQGGGHKHCGLRAVLHGLEHGAHCDLGLAEPDVTAHEPVHGRGRLHVRLHVVDGRELIRCGLEGERVLQLPLPRRVGGEGVTRGVHPLLVKHDQFLRDAGDGLAHLRLGTAPLTTAQPTDRW
jgi:hypothetical protein